jgi:hypothetical protein
LAVLAEQLDHMPAIRGINLMGERAARPLVVEAPSEV